MNRIDNNQNLQRISDFGAQRVLGIRGSLRGYIETGDKFDSFYYNKKNSESSVKKRKENDKNIFKKFLAITGGVLALSTAIGLITRHKGIKLTDTIKKYNPISKIKQIYQDNKNKNGGKFKINLHAPKFIQDIISKFKKKP